MQIWLDTIDLDTVKAAADLGILSGITTNPGILAEAANVKEALQSLLSAQHGPIAVQVASVETKDIIAEGRKIFAFSERLIVKVPVGKKGLPAIRQLRKENIPVMATAVLEAAQAIIAAAFEANYIAIYFSHMENSEESLKVINKLLETTETKILAASLKHLDHIIACAEIGIEAITIKSGLFHQLTDYPQADNFTEELLSKWQERQNGRTVGELLS
ncbi:MAG: fructose-6-phosphate aldolase [Simkaniaceae bacterium]